MAWFHKERDVRAALDDRQIARMAFRIGLFMRRGIAEADAELLADRLHDRDTDRDSRHVCAECRHPTADHPTYGRGCFAARQGWIKGASRNLGPLMTTLQRCTAFEWQVPN